MKTDLMSSFRPVEEGFAGGLGHQSCRFSRLDKNTTTGLALKTMKAGKPVAGPDLQDVDAWRPDIHTAIIF